MDREREERMKEREWKERERGLEKGKQGESE